MTETYGTETAPKESIGLIFETREFSLYDGPGIRTTVFFKGCPLRCVWCHNPEGLKPKPQILFAAQKCRRCGACAKVCRRAKNAPCVACGECAKRCPTQAKRLCGRYVKVDELVKELLLSRELFVSSGGGVTFSGGEPLLQADFLVETARRLRDAGVHIAVETSGVAAPEIYRKVLDAVDLVYQDIKHPDDTIHRRYTGVSNAPILANLQTLKESGKPFIIRVPLVPTVNDSPETLERIADLLTRSKALLGVELLPYHASSGGKYALLGRQPQEIFEEKEIGDEALEPFRKRDVPARVL